MGESLVSSFTGICFHEHLWPMAIILISQSQVSEPSAKARITRPKTSKPMLVPTPAASTAPPCARSMDSAPARSTKVSRETSSLVGSGGTS